MLEPKVILKKEYLDKVSTSGLNSQVWYRQSAIRAVNQSIGRVIRDINDYGAMILIDERFDQTGNKKDISAWLQKIMQTPLNFKD